MQLSRRAMFAAPLALASVPALAGLPTENVQPHSKLGEWWGVLDTSRAAFGADPASAIKRLAHEHFGGLPCVMMHGDRRIVLHDVLSTEEGDFLRLFKSVTESPNVVAVLDIRIDEWLFPQRVYDWSREGQTVGF